MKKYQNIVSELSKSNPVIGLAVAHGLKFIRHGTEIAADAIGDQVLMYLTKEPKADKKDNWGSWIGSWLHWQSQETARKMPTVQHPRTRTGAVGPSHSIGLDKVPEASHTPEFYDGREDVNLQIREALKVCLTDRERKMVELRFGFVTGDEMMPKEIAARLGCSPQNVCEAILKAKNKLRPHLKPVEDYA